MSPDVWLEAAELFYTDMKVGGGGAAGWPAVHGAVGTRRSRRAVTQPACTFPVALPCRTAAKPSSPPSQTTSLLSSCSCRGAGLPGVGGASASSCRPAAAAVRRRAGTQLGLAAGCPLPAGLACTYAPPPPPPPQVLCHAAEQLAAERGAARRAAGRVAGGPRHQPLHRRRLLHRGAGAGLPRPLDVHVRAADARWGGGCTRGGLPLPRRCCWLPAAVAAQPPPPRLHPTPFRLSTPTPTEKTKTKNIRIPPRSYNLYFPWNGCSNQDMALSFGGLIFCTLGAACAGGGLAAGRPLAAGSWAPGSWSHLPQPAHLPGAVPPPSGHARTLRPLPPCAADGRREVLTYKLCPTGVHEGDWEHVKALVCDSDWSLQQARGGWGRRGGGRRARRSGRACCRLLRWLCCRGREWSHRAAAAASTCNCNAACSYPCHSCSTPRTAGGRCATARSRGSAPRSPTPPTPACRTQARRQRRSSAACVGGARCSWRMAALRWVACVPQLMC